MHDINYDKLLDDWAEEVLDRADKLELEADECEDFSYKQGKAKGIAEGYRMSVARLNRMENKQREGKK